MIWHAYKRPKSTVVKRSDNCQTLLKGKEGEKK